MAFEMRNIFLIIVIISVLIMLFYLFNMHLQSIFFLPYFISTSNVTELTFNSNGNGQLASLNTEREATIKLFSEAFRRFNDRRSLLKRRCKVLNLTESYPYYDFFLGERMKFDAKHNFLVCLVAKCAASTWRKHLKNIQRSQNKIAKLTKKKMDSIASSSETIKVITVRNPLDRLISGFLDKFGGGNEDPKNWVHKAWYNVAEKILHTGLGEPKNRSLTFKNYVKFVTSKSGRSDRHFRSIYSNCVPCKVDYDIIVHQETFTEDMSYLFHILNITESTSDIHLNAEKVTKSDVNKKSFDNYVQDLTSKELFQIYDLLGTDFFLFDYPLPDSIENAIKADGRTPLKE